MKPQERLRKLVVNNLVCRLVYIDFYVANWQPSFW